MFGINYRPISVDTVFGRCRQRSLTQPPAHPNPKGHANQSHSSVLCILCCILICWFLLQVQFKTFERGQTVQFVKIEQPRGKKCVNRIKSPFIVCLEIRHKKVRRGKRVRSSEFHKVLSDVKASWTLGYRCVSQQTQRSYQNRHAFLSVFFVDIALIYLHEGSTTFIKHTKYSTLQYCTLTCFQYWKENWWYSTQL
jgi:hypothetical protein